MTDRLYIEMPEEWAIELIELGIGRRALKSRAPGDSLVLWLGVGGSVVSLLQTPDTLRSLVDLVRRRGAMGEHEALSIRVRSNNVIVAEISPEIPTHLVAELLMAVRHEMPEGSPEKPSPVD